MSRAPQPDPAGVMGRDAVLVAATTLLPGALVQLICGDGSNVLRQWGGRPVDVVWSLTLIAAFALLAGTRVVQRLAATVDSCAIGMAAEFTYLAERTGSIFLAAGVAGYGYSLLADRGLDGTLIVLGLVTSSVVNVAGRAALVTWRVRQLNRGGQPTNRADQDAA